jgi:hypothetical protein
VIEENGRKKHVVPTPLSGIGTMMMMMIACGVSLTLIVRWVGLNKCVLTINYLHKLVRSSMALRSVRFGVRSRKLSNVGQSLNGWPNIYYLELHLSKAR